MVRSAERSDSSVVPVSSAFFRLDGAPGQGVLAQG